MQKYLYTIVALVVIILLGWAAYARSTSSKQATTTSKLQVSASFYPLYFFASQIGGDKAQVSNITPAGAEPHDFEPTTRDVAGIEKGNMLVLNGSVESWGDKIKQNLSGTPVVVVIAGEGLLDKQLVEEGKTAKDPHIWLDPLLAKKEVNRISQGYQKIDPASAAYYIHNQEILDQDLDQLDKLYRDGLQNCKSRDIITSHAAFAYLAERYGLHQVAIAGLSPDAEPSAKQLAAVAQYAKKNHIGYIFFESLVSPKLSQTIASEVGAQTLVLDPIEGLSDDDIRSGKNYFTVMEQNLRNLQTVLQCTPNPTTTP